MGFDHRQLTLLLSIYEWYFAKADSMGNAVRFGYKLYADAERSESLHCFLAQQPKGVRPVVTRLKRRGYRTGIRLLKNEKGMRKSLENVVPR